MSKISLKHDTTPATHGDLEVWGGRILEVVDETKQELSGRLDKVEERLDGVDQRLYRVDQRLDGIDLRLDGVDQRLDGIDLRLDGVDQRLQNIGNQIIELKDNQQDMLLMLKAIDKKVSKK